MSSEGRGKRNSINVIHKCYIQSVECTPLLKNLGTPAVLTETLVFGVDNELDKFEKAVQGSNAIILHIFERLPSYFHVRSKHDCPKTSRFN